MKTFSKGHDALLQHALNAWPLASPDSDSATLLRRAEHHGLAGVLSDALLQAGCSVGSEVRFRELARESDHSAHLGVLRRLDGAFADWGLPAVALKGAIFAERYYPRPSARVTGDIDLLVAERHLEDAAGVLKDLGYLPSTSPAERWFRAAHHHLHFTHPLGLPLELHFHAYRGFGGTLSSEPLLARSRAYQDFRTLRVLAADDELLYLAVHGAAHRFGRLSWLFDLRLLIDTLNDEDLQAARGRAQEFGFERPLALAAHLLADVFAMDRQRLALLGNLGPVRVAVVERLIPLPTNRVVRSLSHLAYMSTLCPDWAASMRCIKRELTSSGRRVFGTI